MLLEEINSAKGQSRNAISGNEQWTIGLRQKGLCSYRTAQMIEKFGKFGSYICENYGYLSLGDGQFRGLLGYIKAVNPRLICPHHNKRLLSYLLLNLQ